MAIAVPGILFVLGACASHVGKAPGHHRVEWGRGNSIYTMNITLDGVALGRGTMAYQRLMRELKIIPKHSRFTSRLPAQNVLTMERELKIFQPFPFQRATQKEWEEWMNLCAERDFSWNMENYW